MEQSRKISLDYVARLNQAFRPFSPIDLPDFFKGRRKSVDMICRELNTPGRQVAIYGDRGVGKTSLAKLAYFFADFDDQHTFISHCERSSTYETIFGDLLSKAGFIYLPNGIETESHFQMGITAAGAIARDKRTRSGQSAIAPAKTINSAMLLQYFGNHKGLLIIDEYDRVQDQNTHVRIAETLKHFSDFTSQTKIIIVGVSETVTELLGEHRSLTRCLAQIKLDRMADDELREIIGAGEERLSAVFKESIKNRIIGLSDGFPFYTHLLCLYCAEEGGTVLDENPDANVVISEVEYRHALKKAIDSTEGTLQDDYNAAVITVKRKTEMFKNVLWGIANSTSQIVQVKEIANNIHYLTGKPTKPSGFSSHLGALVKPEKRKILTRVREGHYKFTNPLMRGFVRLKLERHNIIDENGQMEFPWMRDVGNASSRRPSHL